MYYIILYYIISYYIILYYIILYYIILYYIILYYIILYYIILYYIIFHYIICYYDLLPIPYDQVMPFREIPVSGILLGSNSLHFSSNSYETLLEVLGRRRMFLEIKQ